MMILLIYWCVYHFNAAAVDDFNHLSTAGHPDPYKQA